MGTSHQIKYVSQAKPIQNEPELSRTSKLSLCSVLYFKALSKGEAKSNRHLSVAEKKLATHRNIPFNR